MTHTPFLSLLAFSLQQQGETTELTRLRSVGLIVNRPEIHRIRHARSKGIVVRKWHGKVAYVDMVNVDLSRRLSSKVFGKVGAKDEKKRKSWGGRQCLVNFLSLFSASQSSWILAESKWSKKGLVGMTRILIRTSARKIAPSQNGTHQMWGSRHKEISLVLFRPNLVILIVDRMGSFRYLNRDMRVGWRGED